MIKTIAGEKVGLTKHDIVRYDTETHEVVSKCRIRGRSLYVRRCVLAEEVGGGIIQSDRSRDDTSLTMLLAVGEDCEKWHKPTKEKKKNPDWRAQVNLGLEIYDRILFPPDMVSVKEIKQGYHEDEYFCKEYYAICNIGKAGEN